MGKKTIGVCVAKMQSDMYGGHVEALCQCAKGKYNVIVHNVFMRLDYFNPFLEGEIKVFEKIAMDRLDALLIFTESFLNTEIAEKLAERAKKEGIPVISINQKLEGCYNIFLGYEGSFEMIVRHVVEHHNCKKINFMAGFENNSFSDTRIQVFQRVLKENGIPFEPERLAYGQFWEMPARRNAEEWVRQWQEGKQEMPEAIICANDIMALTVCNVLTNHGISIPGDVIVTGFDGLALEQYCTPRLTTACDDAIRIGEEIVHLLDGYFQEGKKQPYDIQIPFQIRISESCGCKPIEACNPNEQIMYLYGRSAQMRIQSTDTFLMMNVLTDNYSAVDMAVNLKNYQKMIGLDNMVIVLNPLFHKNTDIPSDYFDKNSGVLFAQLKEGEYTTPMTEIPQGKEVDLLFQVVDQEEMVCVVPLHCKEEVYGFMMVPYEECNRDLGGFYEFILALDQVLGTVYRQSQLHRMFVTDTLTKLYNRRGFFSWFQKKMEELKGKEKVLFLASVDMDGLKYINDTYGHSEGDFAIQTIARMLQGCMEGRNGICARFGGDEYMAAILTEKKSADTAFYDSFPMLFQKRVERFMRRNQKEYTVSASVGVIYEEIESLEQLDTVMRKADDKMYQCKCGHHMSRTARLREKA